MRQDHAPSSPRVQGGGSAEKKSGAGRMRTYRLFHNNASIAYQERKNNGLGRKVAELFQMGLDKFGKVGISSVATFPPKDPVSQDVGAIRISRRKVV